MLTLEKGFVYESIKQNKTIYQDFENPDKWKISFVDSKGNFIEANITKKKANQLLSNKDWGWEKKTQTQIDKELTAYLGGKNNGKKKI